MTSDQERAAPAQQPVAWRWRVNYRDDWCWSATKPEFSSSDLSRGMVSDVHPLYDHPSSEPELRAGIVSLQAEVADLKKERLDLTLERNGLLKSAAQEGSRAEAAESRVEALSAEVGTARAAAFEEAAQIAEGPIYKERYRGVEGHNWSAERHPGNQYGLGRMDAAAAIRSRAALDKGATR